MTTPNTPATPKPAPEDKPADQPKPAKGRVIEVSAGDSTKATTK